MSWINKDYGVSEMTDMYKNKLNLLGKNQIEINTILRAECPNNCKFCIQKISGLKHPTSLSFSSAKIRKMGDTTLDFFMSKHAQSVDDICFKIMGGEVFDISTNSLTWQDYYYFFDKVIENAKIAKVQIHFNIVTNLLYTTDKLYKIFELIEYLNREKKLCTSLGTSFDIWGRFHTKERLELWKKHFDMCLSWTQEHGIRMAAELVLTKSAFDIFKNPTLEYQHLLDVWNELYRLHTDPETNFETDFIRFYGPASDELMKDNELAEAYKWFYLHYPLLPSIQGFINGKSVCFGGYDGYMPFSSKIFNNCCGLFNALNSYDLSPELSKEDAIAKNTVCTTTEEQLLDFDYVFGKYLNYNNCYMCKYFDHCQFDCVGHWNMKAVHHDLDSHYCWLKDVHNFLEEQNAKSTTE